MPVPSVLLNGLFMCYFYPQYKVVLPQVNFAEVFSLTFGSCVLPPCYYRVWFPDYLRVGMPVLVNYNCYCYSIKPPLKLWHVWVITPHPLRWTQISRNRCCCQSAISLQCVRWPLQSKRIPTLNKNDHYWNGVSVFIYLRRLWFLPLLTGVKRLSRITVPLTCWII